MKVLGVIGIIVLTVAVTVLVVSWSPWDGDGKPVIVRTPRPTTPPPPRLTATEAEGEADLWMRDPSQKRLYDGGSITDVGDCHEEEFNSDSREWIIKCEFRFRLDTPPTPRSLSGGGSIDVPQEEWGYEATLAVKDRSGAVRLVR